MELWDAFTNRCSAREYGNCKVSKEDIDSLLVAGSLAPVGMGLYENIHFTVIPNSPFTIQKIGEILDVKTGSEYDTITSDSLALDKAIHENWKNCRLTDQITITTLLLPFLDVNIKVSYKPKNCEEERQYIIKSVSHDFAGFTSTINMYRFYPAFRSSLTEAGTHNALAGYRNEMLGRYTQEELTTILSKEDL